MVVIVYKCNTYELTDQRIPEEQRSQQTAVRSETLQKHFRHSSTLQPVQYQ